MATYVLAFDCSTPASSVALAMDGEIHRRDLPAQRQSALLVPTIDALMREHAVRYDKLDCIITTRGPGSFTGLRVALATLHGLALAHPVPVKAPTSLEAMAWGIRTPRFHVALNAGKGEYFVQNFTRAPDGPPIENTEILLVKPEAALALGDCYGNIHASDHPHYLSGPDAALLCAMAPHMPEQPLGTLLPLYIRAPDAKIGEKPPWLS